MVGEWSATFLAETGQYIKHARCAGNTLVLKAAEDAPLGVLLLAEVCQEFLAGPILRAARSTGAFQGIMGVVAWPFAASAQQSGLPVIGYLDSRASGDAPQLLAAFRQGVKEAGFVESQNVAIEYRFAENHNERLPALAADLVRRQVNVIATPPTPERPWKNGQLFPMEAGLQKLNDPIHNSLI
jgi:hypothetical protein